MDTRKMFDQEYEKRLLVSQSSTRKKSRVHEMHPGDAVAFDPRMSSPDSGGMSSKGSPGDRFIPMRTDENWKFRFPMIEDRKHASDKSAEENEENVCEGVTYSSLLKNELLGTAIDAVKYQRDSRRVFNSVERKPLFQYTPEKKKQSAQPATCSLSPLSAESQLLLRTPQKVRRKIPKMPYKVLDAPELQDDFYLNLVDWSSQNMLGVGLGSIVYLWSSSTGNVTKLCDFSSDGNSVTSVSWNDRGNYLAIGTHHGFTQVWDVYDKKLVKNLEGHTGRVGCLAWNGSILCSGSRDRFILQHDIRTPEIVPKRKLMAHRQEVCGLRWSPDYQYLASGGNDNRLYIWSPHYLTPIQTYTKHKAAVKALAWSPHHHGLLASGGGTADRCIMFWNTLTGQLTKSVDTGSQVCNLGWAKYTKEIVSTHGYSQNQILVWKYPELIQVAKLLGHSYRVLYLAMSPDGESIVTGAGDETLRFWNIFSKPPVQKENKSVLNLFGNIR